MRAVSEVWGCWTNQRTDQLCILCLILKKQFHLAKSWIIHPNPTELKTSFLVFNSHVCQLSVSCYMLSVCVWIAQSIWNCVPTKTFTKPVFRPQGLQRCGDRWRCQAQCPNSHPGFSIDLSHTSTHQFGNLTVQAYSNRSCFPSGLSSYHIKLI